MKKYVNESCLITTSLLLLLLLSLLLLDIQQYWNLTFQQCSSGWCYTSASNQSLILSEAVTYSVDLATSQQEIAVLLDRIVALPAVFVNASSLIGIDENERFQTTCNVTANDMKYVCLFFDFVPSLIDSFICAAATRMTKKQPVKGNANDIRKIL